MPHAFGYLPFSEFWRLFSNCSSRKLLRDLRMWRLLYFRKQWRQAKKVPIASGDGWKRVNTSANNNDTSWLTQSRRWFIDRNSGVSVKTGLHSDQRRELSVCDEIWLTAVMQDEKSPPMETLTLPRMNNTQSVQGRTVISNGNSQLERQRAHAPVNSYLLLCQVFCSYCWTQGTWHTRHLLSAISWEHCDTAPFHLSLLVLRGR